MMTTRRWSVFVVVVLFSLMLGDRVKATTSISSSSSSNNNKTDLERLLDAAQLKKASLAIVIPWTGGNDAAVDGEVLKMVDSWGEFEACRKDEISVVAKRGGVSLVFLSSLATKENKKSEMFEKITKQGILHCFKSVEFLSMTKATAGNDALLPPWLRKRRNIIADNNSIFSKMFQLPEMAEYDYAFWMETATSVKRKHWIDAMHEEVYRIPRRGFWMKGSFDYCLPTFKSPDQYVVAENVAMKGSVFLNLKDARFQAFVKAAMGIFGKDEKTSWTDAIMRLRNYPLGDRTIRHFFIYTPFMIRCESTQDKPTIPLRESTFLLQGSGQFSGVISLDNPEYYSPPPPTTPPRLLLIMPFPPTPKHLKVVLFHISLWKRDALFPCRESSLYSPYVSLFFSSAFASKGWSHYEDIQKKIEEAVDATGARGCFKEIGFRSRYGDGDFYEKTQSGHWNLSINAEFFETVGDKTLQSQYDYFLFVDPDSFPIQIGWLDMLYEEVLLHPSYGFFSKGPSHQGPTSSLVDGRVINANAFFSLSNPEFLHYVDAIKNDIIRSRGSVSYWFFDCWVMHYRHQTHHWNDYGKYIFSNFHYSSAVIHYESFWSRRKYYRADDVHFPAPGDLNFTALIHGAWSPILWGGEVSKEEDLSQLRQQSTPRYLSPLNVFEERQQKQQQRQQREL